MGTAGAKIVRKEKGSVYLKKAVLGIAAFIIVSGLCVTLVDAHGNSKEESVPHKYYKSIEIVSGDTLWDIAAEYISDDYASIDDYINELKAINHLDSDNIQESQYLTVAYYDTEFR